MVQYVYLFVRRLEILKHGTDCFIKMLQIAQFLTIGNHAQDRIPSAVSTGDGNGDDKTGGQRWSVFISLFIGVHRLPTLWVTIRNHR